MSDDAVRVECKMRFLFEGGDVWTMPYATDRPRTVGSIFNFPIRPDGTSREGKGYIWRVASIDDDDDLVLQFAGQHPDQHDEDYLVYRRG